LDTITVDRIYYVYATPSRDFDVKLLQEGALSGVYDA